VYLAFLTLSALTFGAVGGHQALKQLVQPPFMIDSIL
jgi:hypothetical protein